DAMRRFGSLASGVPLQIAADAYFPSGAKKVEGELRVLVRTFEDGGGTSTFQASNDSDLQILMTAIELAKTHKNVTLVTKDVNFRVRADVYGIHSVDYESEVQVEIDEL